MLDENKVASKQVWTANILDLLIGVFFITEIIVLETCSIVNLFTDVNKINSIVTFSIIQMIVMVILSIPISSITHYLNRVPFTIYGCSTNPDEIDIVYIKMNFYIVADTKNYILFCNRQDAFCANVWVTTMCTSLDRFARKMLHDKERSLR